MKVNLHTHTYLCNHAEGTPREYVETAIKNGVEVLGFSDHVPYPFPPDFYSGFRMRVEETEKYVSAIEALREEYKNDIKILIGYEVEYYPHYFDAMMKNISRFECDYIILGQHFTGDEYDGVHTARMTDDKNILTEYVDLVCTALETEKFTYLAHPDLMCYRGDDELFNSEMTRLCNCAKKLDVPLELNLLGLSDNRDYPYSEFWKIAKKVGNTVVLGSDAHDPGRVGDPEEEKRGKEYLAAFGIVPTEDIKLIKIS